MKDRIYSGLQFFSKNNNKESILEILDEYKEESNILDILHDNGTLFKTAISHDNPSLVSILLNYMYDTNQINTDPKDNNTAQSIKYNELQSVLRKCKKEYNITSEIESLIENICYEHTNDEDSVDFLDYKDDLNEKTFLFIFGNNSTKESQERELSGNEEFVNLEDLN